MSVDSVLDGALTTVLIKAQREVVERAVRPGGLDFGWGGGGQPLVATETDPMLLEVPFDSSIVWAHLYALDGAGDYTPVTASVELRIRTGGLGGSSFLYGTGSVPALSAQGFANLDLTGWRRNLVTGDAVTARLLSLSGTANVVAVTIQLRPTDAPIGVTPMVDDSGDAYVDDLGREYVFRS